ncbi:MAG: hypothetical protein KC940_13675, partial [Candidatus Omnitrophica bacterium]|nr:hypothetical protein [Candidatus Omnitrophota bacterium]
TNFDVNPHGNVHRIVHADLHAYLHSFADTDADGYAPRSAPRHADTHGHNGADSFAHAHRAIFLCRKLGTVLRSLRGLTCKHLKE